MSRTSGASSRPIPPHKAVVSHARSMKRVLAAIVTTWNVRAIISEVVEEIPRESAPLPLNVQVGSTRPGEVHHWVERVWADRKRRPDEYPQADASYWLELWKAAVHLRDMADRLASYAQREGRIAREHAHPANHAVVSHAPEESR